MLRQILEPLRMGQRPYSIRTRIKTSASVGVQFHSLKVRDHIPLEQGLRLFDSPDAIASRSVRDHIPLEQGLRRPKIVLFSTRTLVRDHIPLEQGLRQIISHG